MRYLPIPPNWAAVLTRAVAIWFPIAAATSGAAGLAYLVAQQQLRMTADDPQVALAERAATLLDAGAPASTVVPAERIDLARSLDAFVTIVDWMVGWWRRRRRSAARCRAFQRCG